MNNTLRAALAAIAFAAVSLPALCADDHGHDHGPATPEAAASPRFEAHSDLFELVGVADKGQLTVYLDRYASNEPIAGAKIEFESGTQKGMATPQPDGTYAIKLAGLDKSGTIPFAFTITAGADTDLLAGELAVGDAHPHDEEGGVRWLRWAGFAFAAAVAAGVAFVARRRLRRRRALGAGT